jgi:hypothetical protein
MTVLLKISFGVFTFLAAPATAMLAQDASAEIFRGTVRFHDSVLRRLATAEALPNHIYEGGGTQ